MKYELPHSALTRENYFDFKEFEGKPVISSSSLEYIYPGQGGSIEKLKMFFAGQTGKSGAHFNTGQLLHKYLEDKDNFIVEPDNLPEKGIVDIIDHTFANFPTDALHLFNSDSWPLIGGVLLSSARTIGYQPRWKDETIVNKIGSEGEKYWQFLHAAKGHHMLTASQKVHFEGMSNSINDSEVAEVIFHKDALHEVPILFPMVVDGARIWCKSLIDWIRIVYKDGKVVAVHVIDFKTTSKPVPTFFYGKRIEYVMNERGIMAPASVPYPGSFWIYRYYRQLAFYRIAVTQLLIQMGIPDALNVPVGFKILPIESVAPYQFGLSEQPEEANMLGQAEVQICLSHIAAYYNTLKVF